MPIYEYRCPECGSTRSETISIKEYADAKHVPMLCRSCWAEMNRSYSTPSFTIDGLAQDRFHYEDKISSNRQQALDRGEIALS